MRRLGLPFFSMNYAIDFETVYGGDFGIQTNGMVGYIEHPDFDPYLVSIVGPGVSYAGPPDEAPWSQVAGHTWLSHNYSFDGYIFRHMTTKRGRIWGPGPTDWFCTADLASYIAAPRALSKAFTALFPEEAGHSKSLRKWAKGKDAKEIKALGKWDAMCEYALADSEECLKIWEAHSSEWPEKERRLSQLTAHAGWFGVAIDTTKCDEAVWLLENQLLDARAMIPWEDPPTSELALREYCVANGIPAPANTALDSPEVEAWFKSYGAEHECLAGLQKYRRINKLLQLLKTIQALTRDDGTLPYSLKYFGAHTGRWSGGSRGSDTGKARSLNMQNLYARELFGIKAREMFVARPGYTLVCADLSQIEPRVLAWVLEDSKFLELLASGMSPYEAHARLTMNYRDERPLKEVDANLYKLAKARVLALGYQCGAGRFSSMAKTFGITVELTEATQIVRAFRQSNQALVAFWKKLGQAVQQAAYRGDHLFDIALPSGRCLRYFFPGRRVSSEPGPDGNLRKNSDIVAQVEMGGPRYKQYGGKLCENVIQAIARDVFAENLLKLQERLIPHEALWGDRLDAYEAADGGRILWTVHDEVVAEVPEADAERMCSLIAETMRYDIAWLPGCPIEVDAEITEMYKK